MKRKREPEQEIDFELKDGVMRTVLRPKWVVPHTFHTSSRFMDYLHGDVEVGEAEVACLYEYARESQTMWEAADKRDEFMATGMDSGRAAGAAWESGCLENCGSILPATAVFLDCAAFPKKDWNDLSVEQRLKIIRFFPTRKTQPLPMPDVRMLEAYGALDQLKAMAARTIPAIQELLPGQNGIPVKPVWPILQYHRSLHHVIFTLDFSKSVGQLLDEFQEWLKLAENQRRLELFRMPRIGTTGRPLDRLKDLAAWRLYRELNHDWNAANEFASTHRKQLAAQEIKKKYKNKRTEQRKKIKAGAGKPFRDAKTQGGVPPDEADLFGEEADARKAESSARRFLEQTMPLDFPPPPGPAKQAVFDALRKLASKK